MLQSGFMQRAFLAGVMVAYLAGFFGVFVVQRGLSFLGNGLAHAAFGGVALGILLDREPLWIAVPFTVAVSLGIVWLTERTRLGADTSIGIFFAVSMALGIIFLSQTERFTTDAFAYLFGSILAVRWSDIYAAGALVLLSVAVWRWWGHWAYATFDRELAQSDHVPCLRGDYLLAVSIAVTIVVSMKLVGITLIAAFLVIPAATARLLAVTFRAMTFISICIGVASVLLGLVFSWEYDLPSGPCVILTQAAVFTLAFAWKSLRSG